jgi:hypothetical protein
VIDGNVEELCGNLEKAFVVRLLLLPHVLFPLSIERSLHLIPKGQLIPWVQFSFSFTRAIYLKILL